MPPASLRFLHWPCLWLIVFLPDSAVVFYPGPAMPQNSTLQRLLQHAPMLILWGRVSLNCGWCWLVLESSCVTMQHSSSELSVITTQRPHQGLLPSFGVFVLILVNGVAQWCLKGVLTSEWLYHFNQMHYKQGNCFSPWNPGYPQLPALRTRPSFPIRALSVLTLVIVLTSDTSDSVFHHL